MRRPGAVLSIAALLVLAGALANAVATEEDPSQEKTVVPPPKTTVEPDGESIGIWKNNGVAAGKSGAAGNKIPAPFYDKKVTKIEAVRVADGGCKTVECETAVLVHGGTKVTMEVKPCKNGKDTCVLWSLDGAELGKGPNAKGFPDEFHVGKTEKWSLSCDGEGVSSVSILWRN
jgi:hypothetical protein